MVIASFGYVAASGAGAAQPNLKDIQKGTLTFALGPNVKTETFLEDFNCVDTQGFGGPTTTSWRHVEPFELDPFTTAYGCGFRLAWVKWRVKIGAPYNDEGVIRFGEDYIGDTYHFSCDSGFTKSTMCDSLDRNDGILMPSRCPLVLGEIDVSGEPCTITTKTASEKFYVRDSHTTITNVGLWDDCNIPGLGGEGAGHLDPGQTSHPLQEGHIGRAYGYCFLVAHRG